jgi:hypothetical protein
MRKKQSLASKVLENILFNLHTHRYDGGVLVGLLDGHGHLHSHL